jgi:hypothetical protein
MYILIMIIINKVKKINVFINSIWMIFFLRIFIYLFIIVKDSFKKEMINKIR